MFAGDANFLWTKTLIFFSNVKDELIKNNPWLKANKLSLNVGKTKYSLFHKSRISDYLPLRSPDLKLNENEIERVDPTYIAISTTETLHEEVQIGRI